MCKVWISLWHIPRPPCPSYGKVPNQYDPTPTSVDKAVACTQHMDMETVAPVQTKGQDNAEGPSSEHLWEP